jgi:hypothetical protein
VFFGAALVIWLLAMMFPFYVRELFLLISAAMCLERKHMLLKRCADNPGFAHAGHHQR